MPTISRKIYTFRSKVLHLIEIENLLLTVSLLDLFNFTKIKLKSEIELNVISLNLQEQNLSRQHFFPHFVPLGI